MSSPDQLTGDADVVIRIVGLESGATVSSCSSTATWLMFDWSFGLSEMSTNVSSGTTKKCRGP